MLKIRKLTPELLQEGLSFNEYKKMARPLINAAKKMHQGVDNQVDFFILTNFEFSDKPGKKTTIFIPGKQTANWKKFLKDKFKEDKRNLMIGKCYISGENGNENLNLIPERGNAKMAIIKKQGKRMFQMAKLAVQLASGAEEATNASGGRVNQPTQEELEEQEAKKQEEQAKKEESTSSNTSETTTETGTNLDREALKKMLQEQLKALAASVPLIKNGFNAVKEVVAQYKAQKVSVKDEEKLGAALNTLKEFVASFEAAHKEVQKRMKDAYKKVSAQMPKLEVLHKRIKEQLAQTASTTTSSTESSTGLDPEIIQELRQQMNTAKTEIEKLKKELDLDAILAQVS